MARFRDRGPIDGARRSAPKETLPLERRPDDGRNASVGATADVNGNGNIPFVWSTLPSVSNVRREVVTPENQFESAEVSVPVEDLPVANQTPSSSCHLPVIKCTNVAPTHLGPVVAR